VGGDVSVDSETLLVTDFINLKIKLTQSFKDVYRDKIYIHLFIEFNILTSRDASSSVSAPANPRTGLPFSDTCCKLRPSPSAQVTHGRNHAA
jgi:hypothetical protein